MPVEYDYIIVGSGAGGGPVAANLARAGYRVLLLEAGGRDEPYEYQVPAFHPSASEDVRLSWEFFVRHYANDEDQRRDTKFCPDRDGVFYPRASTLGGCTAHHAMILVAPQNSDWNSIAEATGDPTWRADNMWRYFQRIERCRYRTVQKILHRLLGWSPSRHGFDGWLSTSIADPILVVFDKKLLKILERSALSAFASFGDPLRRLRRGLKSLLDPNDWRMIKKRAVGVRFTPLSTEDGRRVGTRERLLAVQKAFPEHLEIRLGALATRVILDEQNRAVGVEYLEGEHLYRADPRSRSDDAGALRRVHATREVILAGGAFNSPQLLQLSGIGPPELLRKHGIDVLVELPGVGANLQDRYEVAVVNRMKAPFSLLAEATLEPPAPGEKPDPQFRKWERGKGVYTTNGAVISIIKRSSDATPEPDIYLFGLVSDFRGYYPGYSERIRKSHRHFTWAILKAHTGNTAGRVAIRSGDPRDTPDINFHYFDEGNDPSHDDLEAVVDAVEFVRNMNRHYRDFVAEEEVPGEDVRTRDQLRQFVRDEAWGHHAAGTCKIGPRGDDMAVLDSNFRVYGTRNLRVVDASVFPRIPGQFIVSAVYMIAEKASEAILADAQR